MGEDYQLPRAADDGKPVRLRPSLYNAIAGVIEWVAGLKVIAPLYMDTSRGPQIGIRMPPGWDVYRITAAAAGAGKYNARKQMPSGTRTDAAGSALALGSFYVDRTVANDVQVDNLPESGVSGHALTTDGSVYVLARATGRFNAAGLPVVESDVGAGGGGGVVAVNLSTDGGANAATPTSFSTYTYAVTDATSGAILGVAHMAPIQQREKGILRGPATRGFGGTISGTFQLLYADERAELVDCSGATGGGGAATPASAFMLMGA